MTVERRDHQCGIAVRVALIGLGPRGEQCLDGRQVAGAGRDHEHRIAVAVDAAGVHAAPEQGLHLIHAIVGDGNDEILVRLLGARRQRHCRRGERRHPGGEGEQATAAINGHGWHR